jgi:hypothetical protein
MSSNLARQYLSDHNETFADYEGICGELANAVQQSILNSHLIYVGGVGVFHTTAWTYHMAVMVNGIVHDAWRNNPLPLKRWLLKFDCEWPIELTIDGEDVFEGTASEFLSMEEPQR